MRLEIATSSFLCLFAPAQKLHLIMCHSSAKRDCKPSRSPALLMALYRHILPAIVCLMEICFHRLKHLAIWNLFSSVPSWSVGGWTWASHPPLDKSQGFRPLLVSLIASTVLCAPLSYLPSDYSSLRMSYFPPYSYSSPGWHFGVEAGPSNNSNVAEDLSWPDLSSLSPVDIHYSFLSACYGVPISRYSSLAGALTPVNFPSQEDKVPLVQPTPQRVQGQLIQPVIPQPAGLAPQLQPRLVQLQPIQPTYIQQVQPVNPQPVVPSHLGVQNQSVAPPRAANTKRRAYVLAPPPARHHRPTAGTIQFCRVNGCSRWTTTGGKKLTRHRESHFRKAVGVQCPGCERIFARSSACGNHLQTCNPQKWHERAKTKGTQDSWGTRVGQDTIVKSLKDKVYTPRPEHRF
ncbi:hypothetical protein BDM02DRAFT_322242 [Thelephora ganbajun]|uniref:Uncharacterized protein n=1 Tax=Thelephora ganbajun TaxID=370292 RepID=A0ACB6ZRA9_THEGA|nr:hypothetical protein BDM02DRAFT_322242 [Thelephora ganbajun]